MKVRQVSIGPSDLTHISLTQSQLVSVALSDVEYFYSPMGGMRV